MTNNYVYTVYVSLAKLSWYTITDVTIRLNYNSLKYLGRFQ